MTAIYNLIVAFANWLLSIFQSFIDFFVDVINWAVKYIGYLFYSTVEMIMNGLAVALSAIPRPEVFVKAESLFCSNLSALGYAANGIDIGAPLTLIFSAYVLRFVIRRLPVIG